MTWVAGDERRQQQQDPDRRDQVAVALEHVVVAQEQDRQAEEARARATKTDAWFEGELVVDPVDDHEPDRGEQGAEREQVRVGVGQADAEEEVRGEAEGEEVAAVDEADVGDLACP